MRTSIRAAGIIVAFAGLTGLAGCGSATETAIEQATGADVDVNDDGVTITGPSGESFQAGGDVQVPASWPASVPLYDGGELVSAVSAGDGVSLIWSSPDSVVDTFDGYADSLKSAGFEPTGAGLTFSEDSSVRAATFEGNGTNVIVTVSDPGEGTVISVVAAGKS